MSAINEAVEAVMDLIDGLNLFSDISRGALGTGNCLSCEIAPSSPNEIYLDKAQDIPIDLTINGKHNNLKTLSDAMNDIHHNLTSLMAYPSGDDWEIVDILTLTMPQVIGREDNNDWIMASNISIKIYLERA